MGNALFYHLTRSPAEGLLPVLIGKSLQAGWRVELRGTAADRMARLDERLWLGDGFMPHGVAGGPHDPRQPVLLTVAGQMAENNPSCLMALDGAAVSGTECAGLQRACILFDGNDPAATERARDQWRELTSAGVTAEYWSESDGGWQKKR